MKKIILLAISLLSVNSNTYASLQDLKSIAGLPKIYDKIDCELSETSVIDSVYKTQSGNYLSCHQVNSFNSTLDDVTKLIANAPKVSLFIEKQHNNASFDMGKIIRVPLQLTFSGKYGQFYHGSYMGVHTVLAHEYGHAVFSNRIKKYDFYKKIQSLSYQSSQHELAMQEAYANGNPNNIVEYHKAQIDRLFKLRKDDKVFQKTAKLTTAYNELFADVIAVLSMNDKSAVMKALYYDEMDDKQYDMVLARQFSDNSLTMDGSYMFVSHAKFAPVRRYIGEKLWPNSQDEAKALIDNVFKSIVIEIKKELKKSDTTYPTQMNKNLIETLKTFYKSE